MGVTGGMEQEGVRRRDVRCQRIPETILCRMGQDLALLLRSYLTRAHIVYHRD